MNHKKILMLTGWYFPDSIGGTEVYVCSLSRELQKLNYSVEIAIPSNKDEYFYEGVKVNCYPPNLDNNIEIIRGNNKPDNIESFTRLVNQIKPDIVHIHTLGTDCGLFHIGILKNLNIPVVLTAHVPGVFCPRGTFLQWGRYPCDRYLELNKCSACLLNQRGIPTFISKAIVKFQKNESGIMANIPKIGLLFDTKNYIEDWIKNMRDLMSGVDQVVVVSEWLKDTINKNNINCKNLFLSKHGIDVNETSQVIHKNISKKGEIIFSYIGRIDYIKGVHVLIESFISIIGVNIKLKIYGVANTNEEKKYYEYIKKLAKKDKRIIFEGQLDNSNRIEKMENTDVLIIPSILYESGPLVLLEAFNYKIPVIGSNLGGISEKIEDGITGYLFEVGNINELKEAIQKFIDNPDLIKTFSENIHYKQTTKNVALEMDQLYKQF